jgi:hypothetical protein
LKKKQSTRLRKEAYTIRRTAAMVAKNAIKSEEIMKGRRSSRSIVPKLSSIAHV